MAIFVLVETTTAKAAGAAHRTPALASDFGFRTWPSVAE
jgi:hypothetical protein